LSWVWQVWYWALWASAPPGLSIKMTYWNNVKWPGRWICLFFTTLALALYNVGSLQAHAALVRAQPAAGSVLAESPPAVVLDFSEELDARATAVELLDGQSQLVVDGPGVIDPADSRRWQLTLPPLAEGTYSAVWQARSAVDGHVTRGTVAFSVGTNALPPSLLSPPGTPEPATAWPQAADSLLRWLNYLGATMAAGSLLFGWLVWRPAYRRWQSSATLESDGRTTALLRWLVLAGSGIWALATLLFIGLQAGQLNTGPWWEELQVVATGRSGLLASVRLGLLLLLALVAWRLPPACSGRLTPWLLLSAVAAAALLTISLQSHSAALPGERVFLATALDWLHLLAMTTWLGGLLPLAFLLWPGRSQPGLAATLIPRFSRVALPCVLILIGTGLYSTLVHVRTIEALLTTLHGQALSLKIGLFCLLLLLGAVNLLLLTPQLRKAEAVARQRLRLTIRLELLLGVIVLLVVGVMTGVAPAFEALEAQDRLGFQERADFEDVRLVLRIAPLHVGSNEFAVDVSDERPGAAQVEPEVLLRFHSQNQDMGVLQVETEAAEEGRYLARGTYLSVAGTWQIEVILRRAGFDDVRHTFDLMVEQDQHQHSGH